ncbi:Neuropeptide receptor A12, partial [Operophtera brumata]
MSVDRWLSISTEPRLRPPGRRHALLLLVVLWFAALLIFIPLLLVASVRKETIPGLRLIKERKRVAWILLLLAVLFALCWLPYNIMQLLLDNRSQMNTLRYNGHANGCGAARGIELRQTTQLS